MTEPFVRSSLDPSPLCIAKLPWNRDDYAGGWLPSWAIGYEQLEDLLDAARHAETMEQAQSIDRIAGAIMRWWRPLEESRKAMNAWADQFLLR